MKASGDIKFNKWMSDAYKIFMRWLFFLQWNCLWIFAGRAEFPCLETDSGMLGAAGPYGKPAQSRSVVVNFLRSQVSKGIAIFWCILCYLYHSVRTFASSIRPSHAGYISEQWAEFEQTSTGNLKLCHVIDNLEMSELCQTCFIVRTPLHYGRKKEKIQTK